MQSHLSIRQLRSTSSPDKDVLFLPSATPDGKAIIFVHGFGGDPTDTWNAFPALIPLDPAFRSIDAFFYGYDGLRAELSASAAILREFLDRLCTSPTAILKANLPQAAERDDAFAYSSILLVCHSLGAVIARRAITDATIANSLWSSKTGLALFAPAHMGADVVALANEVSSTIAILRFISSAIKFVSPLVRQLEPGSSELLDLRDDVVRLTAGASNGHLTARRVVIAEKERIVKNTRFPGDPPPRAVPGATHISICKPNLEFLTPIESVKACI